MADLEKGNVVQTVVQPYGFRLRQLRDKQHHERKSLVIFFGWLYASDQSLQQYFALYHDKGYDVLFIPGLLKHFAWPPYSMELAEQVLSYTNENLQEYEHFLVHGTSIGAYNYTSCIMLADFRQREQQLLFRKLRGIVFDSITFGSETRMITGVSHGITKSALLRWLIPKTLAFYFAAFPKTTTDFYTKGVNHFQEKPAKVPSLFFYSRNDPMCDADSLDVLISNWLEKEPFPVLSKCWDRSPHAGHFLKHKKEYLIWHEKFMSMCENKSKL